MRKECEKLLADVSKNVELMSDLLNDSDLMAGIDKQLMKGALGLATRHAAMFCVHIQKLKAHGVEGAKDTLGVEVEYTDEDVDEFPPEELN